MHIDVDCTGPNEKQQKHVVAQIVTGYLQIRDWFRDSSSILR